MDNQPDFSAWIGSKEKCEDHLAQEHVARMAMALDEPELQKVTELPALWHWAFFVACDTYANLGRDGHAKLGGFMPPADGRNRMWAGSRVKFIQPLRVGAAARRESTVSHVVAKTGRSGQLLFVTVKHEYRQEGQLCIDEEQDIVYREPSSPKLVGNKKAPEAQWQETITPDATRLFRYSAVTFNGHRIHYDADYVRDVEGYPGLVVHGPLIATSMLQAFQHAHPDRQVTSFSYRALRPLISPRAFQVAGADKDAQSAHLWAQQDGMLAHQASVSWT